MTTPTSHDDTVTTPHAESLAIKAHGLTVTASRGTVFGPLDLAIPRGSLTVITGPDGSGKTSLLLTLVGRMKPSKGELIVLGRKLPLGRNAVQHATSAVGILDELDDAVTVAATLRERKAWLAPWWKIIRTPDEAETHRILGQIFDNPPGATTRIHELDEADNLLLRIALAMMSKPEILVVDQLDSLHEPELRAAVYDRLQKLTQQGTTVIISATNPREANRPGATAISL